MLSWYMVDGNTPTTAFVSLLSPLHSGGVKQSLPRWWQENTDDHLTPNVSFSCAFFPLDEPYLQFRRNVFYPKSKELQVQSPHFLCYRIHRIQTWVIPKTWGSSLVYEDCLKYQLRLWFHSWAGRGWDCAEAPVWGGQEQRSHRSIPLRSWTLDGSWSLVCCYWRRNWPRWQTIYFHSKVCYKSLVKLVGTQVDYLCDMGFKCFLFMEIEIHWFHLVTTISPGKPQVMNPSTAQQIYLLLPSVKPAVVATLLTTLIPLLMLS